MNNIPFYKLSLPISVIMLGMGVIVLFLGFFPVFDIGANFGSNIEAICFGLLFFGFILFVISLIDMSISRRRTLVSAEGNTLPQKSHRILKQIGITIIVTLVIFGAILYYILSNMWG
jgi:hypothetical protein